MAGAPDPTQPGTSARGLLRLGLVGIAFFAGSFVVLHLLNVGEMGLHGRHVSNFAWMTGGWLWQASLVGLGGGTMLVVEGLRRMLRVDGPPRWAFWALHCAGIAILAMTVFRTDRYLTPDANTTLAGYIHDACAVMSTFFICWAMLLMVAAARVDGAWRGIPGLTWRWPMATIGLALAWMLGDVTPGAIGDMPFWSAGAFVQRGVVLVMVAWLLTTGWRALAAADAGTGTPQPTRPPRPTR